MHSSGLQYEQSGTVHREQAYTPSISVQFSIHLLSLVKLRSAMHERQLLLETPEHVEQFL
jgi:hypothetical protein